MKHLPKVPWGGNDLFYNILPDTNTELKEIRAGNQDKTWRQELNQKLWRNAAYWLTQTAFL